MMWLLLQTLQVLHSCFPFRVSIDFWYAMFANQTVLQKCVDKAWHSYLALCIIYTISHHEWHWRSLICRATCLVVCKHDILKRISVCPSFHSAPLYYMCTIKTKTGGVIGVIGCQQLLILSMAECILSKPTYPLSSQKLPTIYCIVAKGGFCQGKRTQQIMFPFSN